jgi:hypothetical protein
MVTTQASLPPYGNGTLAPGVRSRIVTNIGGLSWSIWSA